MPPCGEAALQTVSEYVMLICYGNCWLIEFVWMDTSNLQQVCMSVECIEPPREQQDNMKAQAEKPLHNEMLRCFLGTQTEKF